jgi:hypothetical protein
MLSASSSARFCQAPGGLDGMMSLVNVPPKAVDCLPDQPNQAGHQHYRQPESPPQNSGRVFLWVEQTPNCSLSRSLSWCAVAGVKNGETSTMTKLVMAMSRWGFHEPHKAAITTPRPKSTSAPIKKAKVGTSFRGFAEMKWATAKCAGPIIYRRKRALCVGCDRGGYPPQKRPFAGLNPAFWVNSTTFTYPQIRS